MSSDRPARRRSVATGDFRRRYDDLEGQRTQLLARLNGLADRAGATPSYKRALTLLNATFRKSTLAKRAAVLEAAAWMIDVLERMSMML